MPAAARRGLRWGEPKDSSGRAVRRLRGGSHSILRGAGIPKLKGLLPLHARRVGDDPILLLPPRLLATYLGAPASSTAVLRGRCVGIEAEGSEDRHLAMSLFMVTGPPKGGGGALLLSSAIGACSTT
jgi:hypothetical protein